MKFLEKLRTMKNNCEGCIHKGKWIEQEPCKSCKGSGKKKEIKKEREV